MTLRITKETLKQGAEELARRDTDFARLYETVGLPGLRSRASGYGTILKIISAQQVSVAAARAINGRMDDVANPMTPEKFLSLGDDDIRAIGFSRQKMGYGRGIAQSVVDGDFSFRRIARLDDEPAIEYMVRLKGIGRWTAEVYLLFALRRPDLWPLDDLGIIKGVQILKRMEARPDKRQMQELGENLRPWRSVAARLLWHYFDAHRRGFIT